MERVTEARLEQLRNTLSPRLVTVLGIAIEVRPMQPSNTPLPRLVTVLGIAIDVSAVQNTKVWSGSEVRPLPMITEVRLVHD